jgi:GT2 family glycosyltransferase
MREQLDLSLAIVTYNNAEIIEDTVKSIIDSIPTEYKYKLYIIDNNSSDKTIDIVKKIKGNIEIIELKVNKGFGYGHNAILKNLNSKYHLVVNPDIAIENDEQIKKMVGFMNDNEDVGMMSPLIVNPELTVQYLCKINPTIFDMLIRRISPNFFPKRQDRYVMRNTGYNQIMNIEYASGCFMFFRTDIFKKIKGFDDNFFMYLEDADITRRVNKISKAKFFPQARVIHVWERGSHNSLKLALITVKSMIVYFRKYGLKFF